jgi:hypothetical protein
VIVVGMDPGSEMSACVAWDAVQRRILQAEHTDNETLIERFRRMKPTSAVLVVEQIESFGMAVGKTTFETVDWGGRFREAWYPNIAHRLPRSAIKLHLCHSRRSTDSEIRQAIIDRFGGTKAAAFGTKKQPGPLYECTGHKMAALAVALTWADTHPNQDALIRPGIEGEF